MKKLLLTCMMALSLGVSAQVGPPQATNPNTSNGYGFAQTSGTYVPLSASRTIWQSGAALATDAVSSAVQLPFSFKYNARNYSNVFISNNGFVTFGSPTTAATYTGLSTDLTTAGNIFDGAIAGFAVNLKNANTTTSEISYETVGSKFIIQFTDLQGNSASAAQLISFQIQLDSSNNTISIVYGTCASGTATLTGQVGLKGAESSDVNNRTGTNWTTTAIGTANSSSCTLGSTGTTTIPASGLTFTFTPGTWLANPTTYATLPFTENFSTWVNGNSTADLPNAGYWRSWPSRGDNSWRASDTTITGYTTSSGWTSVAGGATVAAPAIATTARFHSYNTVGVAGYMDLYVDLSGGGVGNRTIAFDYINTSGTDKLDVLLSTDGGTTFTNLGSSLGVAATWGNKSFTTTSTAANAIVRLLATGDNGSTDIQVDNLTITVSALPPACTTISAPANAATGTAINPTITWNAASGATGYLINLGTSAGGTNIMNGVDVGNVTTYTIPAGTPLSYSTQYYITILPKNTFGTATGCTETSFTTTVIPCPSVVTPLAGAGNVALSPTITWSAITGATGYRLTVGTTTGGTDIVNNIDLGNVLSYTFTAPLLAATKYFYKVNAYSGSSVSASCAERNFTTACNTVAAFSENFDTTTVNALPNCWSKVGSTGSVYAQASTVISSPNNLYIYSSSTTDIAMAAMPPLSTLQSGTYRLKFKARSNFTVGGVIQVGYLTNPADQTTFTSLGSFTTTSITAVDNFVLNNVTAPAGVTILAFKHTGSPANSVLIDDVVYELMPSCTEPSAVTVSAISASGATLGWTAPTTAPANGYNIYYTTTNTAPTSGTTPTASVGAGVTTYSMTGLTANTNYYVWVRSNCGSGSTSGWTTSLNVYTGYCTPAPSSVDGSGITNVTFGNSPNVVNNTTVAEAGNYGNYSTMIGDVPAGVASQVSITYATGFTYDTKIWVDLNNNLVFEDAEALYTGTSTNTNPTTLAASITIPASTPLGNYRMRIGGQDAGPVTSCYNGTYGAFEDYTVNVTVAPSCLPPSGLASSAVTATAATLSWTAPATAPANGYEYAYTTTNTAPSSGTSTTATSVSLTPLAPATTYYYWVRSVCSGSSTSTWVTGSITTLATPPANDDCSGSVALTPGATFAQNALTGTTLGSTNATSLAASCLFTTTNVGGNVWYSVVVPASGNLTIETGSVAGSPLLDTVMSVFADCTSTTSLFCDDDGGVDAFSKVVITGQTPGATLLVSVWRFGSTATTTDGQFQISAYDASLATSETAHVKNNLTVYPNPFADVLNISDVKNVKSVSIIDIAGRLVKTIEKPSSALQLGDLKSGMYVVVLNMNDGSKQTIKAIKK